MALINFFAQKLTWRQKMTHWLGLVLAAGLAAIASFAGYHLLLAAPETEKSAKDGLVSSRLGRSDNLVADQREAEGSENAEVLTVAVAPLGTLKPTLVPTKFTGIVTAARSSQLSAKALGRVERVHVDIGDKVLAGSLLVELDTGSLTAERKVLEAQLAAAEAVLSELKLGPRVQEIAQAKTRVDEAQATLKYRDAMLKRFEQLKRSSTISQQEYDESYTAYIVAQAQLESQQKSLDLMMEGTRQEQIVAQESTVAGLKAQIGKVDVLLSEQKITAPFDGRIQKRLIDEGTVVSPGVAILEIVEDESKEVRVGLPVEIAADLAADLSAVSIRLCLGGETVQGEIVRIAPAMDERTRKIEVVLRPRLEPVGDALNSFEDETVAGGSVLNCSDWWIGSAVTVEIAMTGVEDGLWVPAQCLTSGTRGLWSIYLAAPGDDGPDQGAAMVQRCEVEVLRQAGNWLEIRGPLQGDEYLVVSGIHRLTPGQRVSMKMQSLSLPLPLDDK